MEKPVTAPFRLQTIHANGITHRVATVKGHPPQNALPFLIVLLHGWPEGWFTWRHQLKALAEAGFAVCAPDMRGFGGTSAPPEVRDYRIDILCKDVLSIAYKMGFRKILPVGHDFGSYVSWHLALLHPNSVVGVCGMALPYMGHSPAREGLLSKLQTSFGNSLPQPPYCATRKEQEKALFHYILYHSLDHAGEQYNLNAYEALYRIYFFRPDIPSDPPKVKSKLMFPYHSDHQYPLDARSSPGMWARVPRPKRFPSWQSEQEFQYMLHQYEKSGFQGGLNWYKVMDANWAYLRQYKGRKISQPALFLCGKEDRVVLQLHGGLENVVRGMKKHCGGGTEVVALQDTGHWCQQEQPDKVNRELLDFVNQVMKKASKL